MISTRPDFRITVFAGKDVSVVIPTHNRPKSVIRAIESVESQTVKPGEIIVVNDESECSYQATKRYLDEVSIDTDYIESDGKGAAAARNLGAEYAEGDVLMFLDDDDSWRAKKVERQLRPLDDETGLIYSGRIVVDGTGSELFRIDGGKMGDLSDEILLSNVIGPTSGPAIRTDIFETVGGFDERMPGLQDWELWIRLCQETLVDYDPAHTVEWTYHPSNGGQMTSQCERYITAVNRIWRKHRAKFEDLDPIDRRKAKARYTYAIGKRYATAGSRKKYRYIVRSLLYWPTIDAAARLFPVSAVMRMRTIAKS